VPQDSGAQQTDFTTMSASGKISNGVLRSDDLNAASPLLRLTGAGQVDLANNSLDYTAKPTLVNTATGQGGKQLANLQGIVIPVRVYGPFAAPKYQLDVAEALKQDAVQKLTQKLGNGQNGDLVNTLQGLFGKKKQ
jgi:AsmA protein